MRKTIGKLFLILMLLVIYAPILILAVYSFTDSGNIGSIHGFSMQNYVTLFTKGELRDMIVGTVLLALVSSDRKSTRLNSSHTRPSRMPSSA